MTRLILLLAIAATACNRDAPDPAAAPTAATPDATLPGANLPGANLTGDAPAKQSASVLPKPEDQAQLDRLILAGYTPHANHLHPPGVKSCPLSKGTEVVM